jgi:C4-type Zn-finger protein
MKKSFDDYEYLKTNDEPFTCPVCRREVPLEFQEKHHLVPKSKKGKETIILCRSCGDQLHKLFTNKQLEKTYKTIEAILSNEKYETLLERRFSPPVPPACDERKWVVHKS